MSEIDELAERLRRQTALADLARRALTARNRDELVDDAASSVAAILHIAPRTARALLLGDGACDASGADREFAVAAAAVVAAAAARYRREREWERAAFRDPLTGLANRARFTDRATQALALRRRTGCDVALLYIDLDGFKRVNDTLGHAAGDAVLREAARRLHDGLRASDTLARLGGDEFAILAEGLSPRETAALVRRLEGALAAPYGAGTARLSAAIGVAMADDHDTVDSLLARGDAHMYRAKRRHHAANSRRTGEARPLALVC